GQSHATTHISTFSLHDALPIWLCAGAVRHVQEGRRAVRRGGGRSRRRAAAAIAPANRSRSTTCKMRDRPWSLVPSAQPPERQALDRKSTRLNSSHEWISYAVFC